MQECIICKKSIELNLSIFTEHFRQHERKQEDAKNGKRIRCGFCGSEFLNVKKLLQHLFAFHQVSESRINASTSSTMLCNRSSSNNNQSVMEKSNKVLLLMEKDKKIDGILKDAKEKIVVQLQSIIEGYKSNAYISEHLSDEISKSLLESVSTTIQVMSNVVKEASLKDYSDKISFFHDEIILSFTESDNFDDEASFNSIKQEEVSPLEEEQPSEFSPSDFPSTSSTTTAATMNEEESFDPIPVFNLLINPPPIALDTTINTKDGFKKLANDMENECQEFYNNNKPTESALFCNVDVYEQFNSPIGRIILYILFNDFNPEFSKDLITIAWKEAYGILRTVLKIVKPSCLDYRPKDLEPLVSLFLKFIGKEGPNNEIVQAETKKILHQWVRTTRHRQKDHDPAAAKTNTAAIITTKTTVPITIPRRKRKAARSNETIENLAAQAENLLPNLLKVVQLFRRSSSLRLDWMENTVGVDIHTVLNTFTVIKMFPKQLIDVDYEELCTNKKWEIISIVDEMQRILPALKALLQSYNVTILSAHANQNDTFANIFLSFPNLFHHFLNNSKKIPKQFYFELVAQDLITGVNRIVNEKQIQHNFFGRIETPNGRVIFVYVNGHIFKIEGSLLEALELYYRIHYVFRIDRPASIFFLTSWLDLLCKKKVETNCGPQRFMLEIERLCKQFENFPESQKFEFV